MGDDYWLEKIPTASLNENDLVRLQATIRHLKEKRKFIERGGISQEQSERCTRKHRTTSGN